MLLADSAHVTEQRGRYLSRRTCCGPLWRRSASGSSTPRADSTCGPPGDEPGRDSVDLLAERGILVAPGDFYGEAAASYVRVALTATDERIVAAAERLLASV